MSELVLQQGAMCRIHQWVVLQRWKASVFPGLYWGRSFILFLWNIYTMMFIEYQKFLRQFV